MRIIFLISIVCCGLFAQTPAIVSAGYSAPPGVIKTAPGQVLSLMVYGFDYRLQTPVAATGAPLPTTLGGFSVSFQQGGPQSLVPVPMLGVQQTPCTPPISPGPCPALTIISVQIPFEVIPDCPICGRVTLPSYVIVSDNGVARTSILTSLPSDNIHVTDACDTTAQISPNLVSCGRTVVHADGSPVNAIRPAAVGEELVMYAFGLGQTNPLVKSGQATPTPPPVFPTNAFGLNFDFTPNAAPSAPRPSPRVGPFNSMPNPAYAGLVPGFVGLYQINFVVPPYLTTARPAGCGGSVQSNLTVTLVGVYSFDGAGICVQTP